jgi:hypothetical protein
VKELLIGFIILFIIFVLYLNIAASIIAVQEKDIRHTGVKIARIAFIWLIPIIGFALILRFTQQAEECHQHYSLIPKFIQNWLYDESIHISNKNRDDNDLKTYSGHSNW